MLDYEFKKEISRLTEAFPQHFSSGTRIQLIFERIKDFEHSWLRKIVDRIILTNDPRFNFEEAARGERLAKKSLELTRDVIAASEAVSAQISENGLSEALKAFGVNSLTEAIFKNQKGEKENGV